MSRPVNKMKWQSNSLVIDKKLEEIYHSLNEIAGTARDIRMKADSGVLREQLAEVEKKLSSTQKIVLEKIIEDAIDNCQIDQGISSKEEFGLKEAVALIQEVEKKATQMKMSVIIAVYNEAAHPIAVHCMNNAYIASYDVATNKAYTCAALKMPTTTLKKLCQPGQELYGLQFTNQGKIIIFGGGVPLYFKGKLVGALGVSGGTEEQDTMLAEYGSKMLEEVMT